MSAGERWIAVVVFAGLAALAGLALWLWGPAAGVAVAGLGLGAAPARRRVSRAIVRREVESVRREELIHRVASRVVAQDEIAANHRRAADEARQRRLEAQARLEEIEREIGGRR